MARQGRAVGSDAVSLYNVAHECGYNCAVRFRTHPIGWFSPSEVTVSPILVRPVREQLEHDRVIRLLQVRLKRKGTTSSTNIGDDQTVPVRIGQVQMFPDLVLTSTDRGHKLMGTSRSKPPNRSTTSKPWRSGRTSAGPARHSICMCRPDRSTSRAGWRPRTRSTSRRSGAITRSATRPGSRWCTARADVRNRRRVTRVEDRRDRRPPPRAVAQRAPPRPREARRPRKADAARERRRRTPARPSVCEPARTRKGSSPAASAVQPRQARLREHVCRPHARLGRPAPR